MSEIVSNSVLPAHREHITLQTSDGLRLVGELAMPLRPVQRTIICFHPNPLQNGYMDSHVFRKLSWRFPALYDTAVLRFNFRGVSSAAGTSEGQHGYCVDEGLDLDAAVHFAAERGLPKPWLVGWSFGTNVILKHGNEHDIAGAVLLSPTLKWTQPEELDVWANNGKPVVCAIPEFDDFLRPDEAVREFARIPQAKVIAAPGAKHLWIGEAQVRQALQVIAQTIVDPNIVLQSEWDGPMERWTAE